MAKVFHIYTDGGCRVHTDKLGSWGYVVINMDGEFVVSEDCGIIKNTTSYAMELTAAIEAITHAINILPYGQIVIHSDSEVLIKGMTTWMYNWKKRGWRKSCGTIVSHKTLWEKLDIGADMIDVDFKWVKGHNGHEWNEYAHKLTEKVVDNYINDNK